MPQPSVFRSRENLVRKMAAIGIRSRGYPRIRLFFLPSRVRTPSSTRNLRAVAGEAVTSLRKRRISRISSSPSKIFVCPTTGAEVRRMRWMVLVVCFVVISFSPLMSSVKGFNHINISLDTIPASLSCEVRTVQCASLFFNFSHLINQMKHRTLGAVCNDFQ